MRWALRIFGLAFVLSAPGLGASDGAAHHASGRSVLIQIGAPRSASTFQWMALILIAEILAAKTNRYIHYQFVSKLDADQVRSSCPSPSEAICVLKAHRRTPWRDRSDRLTWMISLARRVREACSCRCATTTGSPHCHLG